MTYGGSLGLRLGVRTAVLTSCAPDLPLQQALEGAELHIVPAGGSTTFRNLYDGSRRTQVISGIAAPLGIEDVPPAWRASRVVLLGPVAGELRPDLFGGFRDSLIGLTPQGMMRGWDESGRVYPKPWEPPESLLRTVDAVVLSEDDLSDMSQLGRYLASVRIVAVTHAEHGATVYMDGVPTRFPAYECPVVDPTGAGDVFATAFLLELQATGNVARAAPFANSAASFVIAAEGAGGLPDREQVLRRVAEGRPRIPSPRP